MFSKRNTNLVPARRIAAVKRCARLPLVFLALVMQSALAAAPAKIDLNAFDALKKSVPLPNGESLAYVSMGGPAGPAVVLIHGYTDSARDWVPLVPYLSPRLRLILVDIRGHGRSGKPECCYTRLDFAYDIKLLLDALGVQRADIVGHSLGSFIAQTFAEYWPERTRRVILISSSGGPKAGAPPRKPSFDYAAQIRQLKEPIDPDSPIMIEWWSSRTPVDEDFTAANAGTRRRSPCACGWRFSIRDSSTGISSASTPICSARCPSSRRRRCSSGAGPIPSWGRRCARACVRPCRTRR